MHDRLNERHIAAARLWAVTRLPYLARAIFACPVRPADGIGTIAIDRSWVIGADPRLVEQLAVDELGRLLVHLVTHAVRDHAARAEAVRAADSPGGRARWNRAADAEVNDDLTEDDCVPGAAPDLPSDLGCGAGGLAEACLRDAADGPRRWDCGSGCDGGDRPWDVPPGRPGGGPDRDGLDPAQAGLLRLSVAADVQRQHGREPGSVAAGWQRWAEAVLPSRVDWRRVLAVDTAVHAVSSVTRASQVRIAGGGGTDMGAGIEAAAALRPRPSVVVVLTDGFTPWPPRPPRGCRVVVGLLAQHGVPDGWAPPPWARTVVISEP